jgi:hypothetical protein
MLKLTFLRLNSESRLRSSVAITAASRYDANPIHRIVPLLFAKNNLRHREIVTEARRSHVHYIFLASQVGTGTCG